MKKRGARASAAPTPEPLLDHCVDVNVLSAVYRVVPVCLVTHNLSVQ